jgi:ribosomal protein S24E
MEYIKNIQNALMKRQEISFIAEGEKNPGFAEMRKKISEELNKSEENIEVYGVKGKFGRDTFLVKAYIYDSKKDLDAIKVLSKTKKQRKTEKEETKKSAEEAKKAGEEVKEIKEETKS